MPSPPDTGLVAPSWCAVEPLIHAPQTVQSACVGGIRVVDDAVFEDECAHSRPLPDVGPQVGSGHRCHLARVASVTAWLPRTLAPVVVFNASFTLLLLGESHGEVGVEVAPEGGRPRKCPAHSLLERLQLR